MRKAIILFGLLAAMQVMAQDKSIVTVKSGEVTNGVVILTVHQTATPQQAADTFALHCNKGMTACNVVEPGTYVMVRLPKNWGMYDCANVDLYASTADPASGEKLGEYCLIEK
ncbi:MAG: hypothetical protein ABSC64_09410 [Candidatus Korobacteraceae bacterium]|jgi:hypothetical protein